MVVVFVKGPGAVEQLVVVEPKPDNTTVFVYYYVTGTWGHSLW